MRSHGNPRNSTSDYALVLRTLRSLLATFLFGLLGIHAFGDQASEIIHTIIVGVPEKGMVPWGGILSPEQINQVAAYVITKYSEATGRPLEEILAPPNAS